MLPSKIWDIVMPIENIFTFFKWVCVCVCLPVIPQGKDTGTQKLEFLCGGQYPICIETLCRTQRDCGLAWLLIDNGQFKYARPRK